MLLRDVVIPKLRGVQLHKTVLKVFLYAFAMIILCLLNGYLGPGLSHVLVTTILSCVISAGVLGRRELRGRSKQLGSIKQSGPTAKGREGTGAKTMALIPGREGWRSGSMK